MDFLRSLLCYVINHDVFDEGRKGERMCINALFSVLCERTCLPRGDSRVDRVK